MEAFGPVNKQVRKFFFEDTKGAISHTKFFSVAASIIILLLFVVVVAFQLETDVELWIFVGSAFLANRSVNKLLELKYQHRRHRNNDRDHGTENEMPEN